MFKILDKFGGEVSANEQAIFNKISTNNSSGYVNGYLNSLAIARLTSNMISIDSGLLSIQGFRFVNDTLQTYTVSVTPSQPIPFQLVAVFSHYVSSENDTLEIITRPTEELRQENLYGGSNAVYELELARFTMTADGITDFVATLEQLTYNDQDFTEVLEKVDNAESDSEAALKAANAANSNATAAVNTANSAASTANLAKTASDTATAKVAELSEQIGEKQGTTVTIGGVAQGRVALESATVGNAEKLGNKAASEYIVRQHLFYYEGLRVISQTETSVTTAGDKVRFALTLPRAEPMFLQDLLEYLYSKGTRSAYWIPAVGYNNVVIISANGIDEQSRQPIDGVVCKVVDGEKRLYVQPQDREILTITDDLGSLVL